MMNKLIDYIIILAGIITIVYFTFWGIAETPRSYHGLESITVFEPMAHEPYDATVKPWTQGVRK